MLPVAPRGQLKSKAMKTTISTLMAFSILGLAATPVDALTTPRSSHEQQTGPTSEQPTWANKPMREPGALFASSISDDQMYSHAIVIGLDAFEIGGSE
jgi:hypothetical protein